MGTQGTRIALGDRPRMTRTRVLGEGVKHVVGDSLLHTQHVHVVAAEVRRQGIQELTLLSDKVMQQHQARRVSRQQAQTTHPRGAKGLNMRSILSALASMLESGKGSCSSKGRVCMCSPHTSFDDQARSSLWGGRSLHGANSQGLPQHNAPLRPGSTTPSTSAGCQTPCPPPCRPRWRMHGPCRHRRHRQSSLM